MLWKQEHFLKLYLLSWGMRVHFKVTYICLKHVTTLSNPGRERWWGDLPDSPSYFWPTQVRWLRHWSFSNAAGFLCSIILKLRNESSISARSGWSNTSRFKSAKRKKLPGSIEEQKLFLGLATTEEIPALGQNLPVNFVVPFLELRCLKCFFLHVLVTM